MTEVAGLTALALLIIGIVVLPDSVRFTSEYYGAKRREREDSDCVTIKKEMLAKLILSARG